MLLTSWNCHLLTQFPLYYYCCCLLILLCFRRLQCTLNRPLQSTSVLLLLQCNGDINLCYKTGSTIVLGLLFSLTTLMIIVFIVQFHLLMQNCISISAYNIRQAPGKELNKYNKGEIRGEINSQRFHIPQVTSYSCVCVYLIQQPHHVISSLCEDFSCVRDSSNIQLINTARQRKKRNKMMIDKLANS